MPSTSLRTSVSLHPLPCVWPALLLVAALGCASEDPGIAPSRDSLYFPTGLALGPKPGDSGGSTAYLYVSNMNADLNYNGGTLMALSLAKLPSDLSPAKVSAAGLGCKVNRVEASSWECPESSFIVPGATLRVGDFPGELRLTRDGKRLFVPVRGANYLLAADAVALADGSVDLRCNYSSGTGCDSTSLTDCEQWDCDGEHRVQYSEDIQQWMPKEPFGISLNELVAVHSSASGERQTCLDGVSKVSCQCTDSAGASVRSCDATKKPADVSCCISPPKSGVQGHIYLTHLSGGEASFLTVEASGVKLRDIQGGFFSGTSSIRGAYSVAPRLPGDSQSPVFMSSRVDSTLASFRIKDDASIVDSSRFSVTAISPANDVRSIAFNPGGDTLYLLDRLPPSLVSMDMSLKNGQPVAESRAVVEVCEEPTQLRMGKNPLRPDDPDAYLLYVVCFASALITVVDATTMQVVDLIPTGRGPYSLTFDPAGRRAFVSNWLENTIGVIDMDPAHVGFHRMVMRIGLIRDLVQQ